MNYLKFLPVALIIATAFTITTSSCKKGTEDPAISMISRKDRFTNTWTLVKYEKNAVNQDLNGTTYTYTTFNNGTLNQTIEGSIFGFPSRTDRSGTWEFLNEDEDVKIIINNKTEIYNIHRLASKELWLKLTDNTDTYIYYFEGL